MLGFPFFVRALLVTYRQGEADDCVLQFIHIVNTLRIFGNMSCYVVDIFFYDILV